MTARIDLHTHFVPKEFPDLSGRAGGARWPRMEMMDAHRAQVMISGKNFRAVTDQCWDGRLRLLDMEQEAVTEQVISPMPELFSYWAAPSDALDFCRALNEGIAELARGFPGRFHGLGQVPLQDPDLAAKELAPVRSMGLLGVEAGSHVLDVTLADPKYTDFLDELVRQDLCLFVHAFHPAGADRFSTAKTAMVNAVAFPTDTALTIGTFIGNGVFERWKTLRVAFSHGGGAFAMCLPRLLNHWQRVPDLKAALPQSPVEYARRAYYDTLVYQPEAFRYIREWFGVDRLIVGSDYPFAVREIPPGNVMGSISDLSPEDRRKIDYENCRRFLGLA
jgi:aminocarboxymuconate-semialdehyde decarboxylase